MEYAMLCDREESFGLECSAPPPAPMRMMEANVKQESTHLKSINLFHINL